jgi:hypothetical protein
MLGFSKEAQGWLPCKIVEEDPQGKLWTVNWWDQAQGDRLKGEEDLRPFEEAGILAPGTPSAQFMAIRGVLSRISGDSSTPVIFCTFG